MKKYLRKPLRRLLSLVLIGTLVSQSTLQNVSAKGSVPKGTETAVAAEAQDQNAAQPQILNEIAENRSYFSKEYLLSDNSREILVYPQQIHYQTEDGVLAEIGNSLIPTEDGYQNGSNSYELVVTDNQDSQGEVIYREGDVLREPTNPEEPPGKVQYVGRTTNLDRRRKDYCCCQQPAPWLSTVPSWREGKRQTTTTSWRTAASN